jgi:hypothetical protein
MVDLHRLSHAVAKHETGGCTKGVARYSNCHGILVKGKPLHFDSKEESHAYFIRLWLRRYGWRLPTLRDATTYVCGGRWPTGKDCPGGSPTHWRASVLSFYSK